MAAAAKDGLLPALLAVQGEATTLPKDAENPHFRSKYTPLDTIVEKVGPLLNKHGLVWTTLPGRDDHGDPALTYRLAHAASGEVLEGTMPLLLSKNDPQGQGSAITYARRYALCSVLNLVADDDDDGNSASGGDARQFSRGSGRPASEKQVALVRKLLKQKRLTVAQIRPVLIHAGVPAAETADVEAAVAGLTGAHASNVIDSLTRGPVPNGATDAPADPSEFTHEPVEADPALPFDPSVPA